MKTRVSAPTRSHIEKKRATALSLTLYHVRSYTRQASRSSSRSLKRRRPEVKTEKLKQKSAIFRLLLTFLFLLFTSGCVFQQPATERSATRATGESRPP